MVPTFTAACSPGTNRFCARFSGRARHSPPPCAYCHTVTAACRRSPIAALFPGGVGHVAHHHRAWPAFTNPRLGRRRAVCHNARTKLVAGRCARLRGAPAMSSAAPPRDQSELIEFLARMPLFAYIPPEELTPLVAVVQRRRYPRGAVLFTQGQLGNVAF